MPLTITWCWGSQTVVADRNGMKVLFMAPLLCWIVLCIPLLCIFRYEPSRLTVERSWVVNGTCNDCQSYYTACVVGTCYVPVVQFVHDVGKCKLIYGQQWQFNDTSAHFIANTAWPQSRSINAFVSLFDVTDCCFEHCRSTESGWMVIIIGAFTSVLVWVHYVYAISPRIAAWYASERTAREHETP